MGRKQRRRKGGRAGRGSGATAVGRKRRAPVPWRERAREVLRALREYARERYGEVIEAHLAARFGDEAGDASVADLQLAFDDFVCVKGGAGDGRSIVQAFVEDSTDLPSQERESLPKWETERARRVYLLDRAHRDRMDLWDPIAGGRAVLHLIDKMPPAGAAALRRGTVVIASSAPWVQRRIVLGSLEMYEADDAVEMYRREVRESGRTWHELPPLAPS
jgi:hypothetical protein